MKSEERKQARNLRRRGWSMNEIASKLDVAKSTVSYWVRDVNITPSQKQHLSQKGHTRSLIEKRRSTRLHREDKKRALAKNRARKEVPPLTKQDLFLIGSALYWAEGRKTNRGIVSISNGDPRLIQISMRFFSQICEVPKHRFRGHIHIHPHLDPEKAKRYWAKMSGIPEHQFYKTYNKPNISSKNKKDTLPYGTLSIIVCDTQLFLRIQGWIEGMIEELSKA